VSVVLADASTPRWVLERRCRPRVERPRVNGVRIDPVSVGEFLGAVSTFLSCGHSHVIHFLAAHPTVEARRDPGYRALLDRGALNVPDGMAVAWAVRLFGTRTQRLAGTEATHLTAAWGVERGLRHYLYGATPETLQRMRRQLERSYPGILVVGAESPPFRPMTDAELAASARRMQEAGAQVVWVGLGAPKQDVVAHRLRELRAAPVIMCVGAAFDFVAGTARRAPGWMRQIGLEWVHRLLAEPRRLWKRYLIGNPAFVWGVVRDRLASLRPNAGR
jgi:N-acetylglucosaminyldiphosphoundecaprenol N-acetyl-beta-D-mannosaminyltransferase